MINANFRFLKRQPSQKTFKVKIKLEKNHIPILNELKNELKKTSIKGNIIFSKNHFFVYFYINHFPFPDFTKAENFYGKELNGKLNISLGYASTFNDEIKLKLRNVFEFKEV